MWRAERTLADKAARVFDSASDGVNAREPNELASATAQIALHVRFGHVYSIHPKLELRGVRSL